MCILHPEEADASLLRAQPVSGFALWNREPLKGVISGVVLRVEVDQRKNYICGVCDARYLVRPGGNGETENIVCLVEL